MRVSSHAIMSSHVIMSSRVIRVDLSQKEPYLVEFTTEGGIVHQWPRRRKAPASEGQEANSPGWVLFGGGSPRWRYGHGGVGGDGAPGEGTGKVGCP